MQFIYNNLFVIFVFVQIKVQVCVQFFKVGEIDTLKEQYTADVIVRARWREPTLDGKLNEVCICGNTKILRVIIPSLLDSLTLSLVFIFTNRSPRTALIHLQFCKYLSQSNDGTLHKKSITILNYEESRILCMLKPAVKRHKVKLSKVQTLNIIFLKTSKTGDGSKKF